MANYGKLKVKEILYDVKICIYMYIYKYTI